MKARRLNIRARRLLRTLRGVVAGRRVSVKSRIAAGALLSFIATFAFLRCNPEIESRNVPGLVLEIDATGIQTEQMASPHARVLIAVGDTTETHLLLPPPVPRPGHFIPLKVMRYHKGNVEYSLDLERWLAEGPS